jgi:hypothetical protein
VLDLLERDSSNILVALDLAALVDDRSMAAGEEFGEDGWRA